MKEFADRVIKELQNSNKLDASLLDQLRRLLEEQYDQIESEWLHGTLDALCAAVAHQFRQEEEGGYLNEVLEQFPTWERQVDELRTEHLQLQSDLAALRDAFQRPDSGNRISRELRDQIHEWFDRYSQHQHREADLILAAFTLDVGVGE